jgi:LEA14-like dessication related protein
MGPGYESPTVTLSSFKSLPSEGGLPAFEIGLRVINPNPEPLELRGIAYTISLNGHELIKGVGNELPIVDGYGEGEFKLTAAANLFGSIRLISDLMRNQRETLTYEFEAKLDIGAFRPAIRISESNEIALRSSGDTL